MKTLLNEALSNMPTQFSSHQFSTEAQRLGVDMNDFKPKLPGFLIAKCEQVSKKIWQKEAEHGRMTDQECINQLKKSGEYRIMASKWEEV